jgi:ankyrin repeat protein
MSFVCLSLASVRLFYSQRLGKYREPDPSILSKQTLIAIPICIQNAIYLSAWIFLTAYVKVHVLWCICLVIFLNFVAIQTFVFRLNSSELVFDAMLNGVKEGQWESESRKIFYTAIFTSWISPYIVWTNNKPIEILKKRLGKSNMSKYFLLISNATTSITLIIILSIYCYGVFSVDDFDVANNPPLAHCFRNETLNNCSDSDVTNNPPLAHCFQNETLSDCSGFLACFSICYAHNCPTKIRVCDNNEISTDLLTFIIAPILIGLLAFNIFFSYIPQILGSYETMYKLTIIHPTLIMDYAKEEFYKKIQNEQTITKVDYKSKLVNLLKDSTKDIMNQQNPITGNTCLLDIYYEGCYELVKEMIEKGADPKIKNKAGKSVESYQKRDKIEEITEKKRTWKNETFVYEVVKKEKKCKIILRDEDKSNGNIYWNLDFEETKDPLIINYVLAFGNEACKILESSEEIGKGQAVFDMLADLSTFERNTQNSWLTIKLQKIHSENNNENETQSGISECIINGIKFFFLGIFWTICSFIVYLLQCILRILGCDNLHTCVASHKMWNFWISHFIFGASMEAKNSNGFVPLQVAIQSLSKYEDDTKFARYLLYLGAANYAKTEEEKDQVLKTLDLIRQPQSSTCFWCLPCYNRLPVESLTHIFVHAVLRFCKEKNENLETVPKSKLKNGKENMALANINTMSSSNTEQKEKVEEPLQISELIKYLLKLGFYFGAVNEKGETVFHQIAGYSLSKDLEILLENHDLTKAINQPNEQLQTPIQLAVQSGNSNYVGFLIGKGADLNAQDLNLRTPLHYAVSREKDECLKLLLENEKAFVDAQDCEMKSPLHIAVIEGKSEFAKKLFLHQANANLFDKKLNSPSDYATLNGNRDIEDLLLKSKENVNQNLQSPNEQNQTLPNLSLCSRSSFKSLNSTSYGCHRSENHERVELNFLEDLVAIFQLTLQKLKKGYFIFVYVLLFFGNTVTDFIYAISLFKLGYWNWALSIILLYLSPFMVDFFFWYVKWTKNNIRKLKAEDTGSFSSVLGHLPVYQHFR